MVAVHCDYLVQIVDLFAETIFFKNFIHFYHIYFFLCIHCFYVMFRIKTPKLFGVILLSLRWAIEHRFQICEVKHCRLCLTSAKQILINKLKTCPFSPDKSRTTHNWNDRRSRRVFLCFYSAIFQLMSAKFQTFAYNSRTVGSSYMKF